MRTARHAQSSREPARTHTDLTKDAMTQEEIRMSEAGTRKKHWKR